MKRALRLLLNAATRMSIAACATIAVLWLISHAVGDVLIGSNHAHAPPLELLVTAGHVRYGRTIDVPATALETTSGRTVYTGGLPLHDYPFTAHCATLLAAFAALPLARLLPRATRWAAHRRRRPPGLCPACGYDLRASPDRCPECGHEAPPRVTIEHGGRHAAP